MQVLVTIRDGKRSVEDLAEDIKDVLRRNGYYTAVYSVEPYEPPVLEEVQLESIELGSVLPKIRWFVPRRRDGSERPDPVWPELFPFPSKGEIVHLDGDPLWVRALEFYPMGDGEKPDPDEPYLYIVLADKPH